MGQEHTGRSSRTLRVLMGEASADYIRSTAEAGSGFTKLSYGIEETHSCTDGHTHAAAATEDTTRSYGSKRTTPTLHRSTAGQRNDLRS
jgi:hypothetical protein